MSTHSEFLRYKIRAASGGYREVVHRFWTHDRLPELFPRYLVRLHGIIRASVPLMTAARAEAERRGPADPVAAPLAAYLTEHIEEEERHDEWLLEDIESVGLDREEVLERPPSPTIASVVGAQYYWIHHHHPVALMGYIALLEGSPPPNAYLDEVRDRAGLPESAFRTLRMHGDLDIEHRDELFETIDALPLTPDQAGLMGMNALWTQHLLARSLEELMELFEEQSTVVVG